MPKLLGHDIQLLPLSDAAAAEILDFFGALYQIMETRYASQIHRHYPRSATSSDRLPPPAPTTNRSESTHPPMHNAASPQGWRRFNVKTRQTTIVEREHRTIKLGDHTHFPRPPDMHQALRDEFRTHAPQHFIRAKKDLARYRVTLAAIGSHSHVAGAPDDHAVSRGEAFRGCEFLGHTDFRQTQYQHRSPDAASGKTRCWRHGTVSFHRYATTILWSVQHDQRCIEC